MAKQYVPDAGEIVWINLRRRLAMNRRGTVRHLF